MVKAITTLTIDTDVLESIKLKAGKKKLSELTQQLYESYLGGPAEMEAKEYVKDIERKEIELSALKLKLEEHKAKEAEEKLKARRIVLK